MKLRVWCLGFLVCLGVAGAWAAPQRSAPQQKITVVVVDADLQPARPVQSIRVSLTYLNNPMLITASQDVTNRSGQVFLQVSPNAAQSGDIRIEITGASDLVVYQPADGQLAGLPATVTISLLPKGSPALLGPVQIEAMLRRLSFQTNAKSQEIHALKGALAAAQSQKPDDLTAAMTEWAKANGFAIADVDMQVRRWAEEIQRRKEQATAEQKGLSWRSNTMALPLDCSTRLPMTLASQWTRTRRGSWKIVENSCVSSLTRKSKARIPTS